ncbi:redoxin domain-containing protein [Winogradskyella sp. Asnod2-B02-A]|uniref:redoxin domain-containing protein n=1 Tax=Winogradskyella sp. Asnod2-B02-A TaxID=3160583 RepID=UPI003869E131
MKKLTFVILILVLFCCKEESKAEFSLTGKTEGVENGMVIYLVNDAFKDSTVIENNSFSFKTKLPYSPIQAILRTKDNFAYRFLWLEENSMTFDASNGDFLTANVTGSESENLSQDLYRVIDTLPREERLKKELEFVKKNPNSIVSASMLAVYSTTFGKEKTTKLFKQFSKKNKNSEYGEKIAKYIKLNKEPKIGEQFADFEMTDQNGKVQKLSDIKGKAILLEFWSSWCGPCRKENPNLVKTYEKYQPKGFEIFAVSLDQDKDSWLKAIEKDRLIWQHVSDLKSDENEASLIYGITGIPDNFLIAENGQIIGRNLRGDELNQKLSEVLD